MFSKSNPRIIEFYSALYGTMPGDTVEMQIYRRGANFGTKFLPVKTFVVHMGAHGYSLKQVLALRRLASRVLPEPLSCVEEGMMIPTNPSYVPTFDDESISQGEVCTGSLLGSKGDTYESSSLKGMVPMIGENTGVEDGMELLMKVGDDKTFDRDAKESGVLLAYKVNHVCTTGKC